MRAFRVVRAWTVAAALLLVGCATEPGIPFDRASAGPIKSIGIVTPHFPQDASVVLASSVGQSFGLIGLLIDAGMQANRDSTFKSVLQQQNFSARDHFLQRLAAALEAQGYTTAMIAVPRNGPEFLEQYPNGGEPKVDAFLDLVALSYGYIAAGIGSSSPYRPQLTLRTRLVSARDSAVLMQDMVTYNPVGPAQRRITIAPDPEPQFADFDALVAAPEAVVKGLQLAAERSAETIGKLLQ